MQDKFTKQEFLLVIAVVGNTAVHGDTAYKAYQKLKKLGVELFGETFREKIGKLEAEIFDNASPFYAIGLEELIEKVATEEVK